jgi:hypothetical protein
MQRPISELYVIVITSLLVTQMERQGDMKIYVTYIKYTRLRHYATSRNVAGSIPDEVTGFFNLPNPSSRTMDLGSTQPLTEMSTRNFPAGKGRPARKADNLTAIC